MRIKQKLGPEGNLKITALPAPGTKVSALVEDGHYILNDGTHTGHDESNPDDPNEVSGLAVALAERLKEFGIGVEVNGVG